MAVDFQIHLRAREFARAAEVIAGIILAAGASTRMGASKALLDYRGETFLNRLIRVYGLVCDPVIVVLGYNAALLQEQARGRARFAVNPAPERGQLSSLQTALSEVPAEADGFFFTPVDSPAVAEETLARLVRAFAARRPETLFVIPRFGDSRGHPVCCVRSLADEFLAPTTGAASEVVHRYVERTEYVDVDDPGILIDVDDPEAYRRLSSAPASSSAPANSTAPVGISAAPVRARALKPK